LASYPTFLDWQAATPRSLAGLGFVRGDLDVLSTAEGPLRATTGFVSQGYFKTLGATPLLGRFFTSDEEAAGHGNAAVLSERLWRSEIGIRMAVAATTRDVMRLVLRQSLALAT